MVTTQTRRGRDFARPELHSRTYRFFTHPAVWITGTALLIAAVVVLVVIAGQRVG